MEALLIDLDGVLYEGDKAVNGGAEAVAWLQQEGIPFRFVTNTSSRPRQNIVEKLAAMGVSVTVEQLFTPPVAARQWLVDQQVASVALFVPVATATEFVGLPVVDSSLATGVDAVVLGDLGQGWSFERLNQAFRLLMSSPDTQLVALGLTRYWAVEDGLQLDVGPFVKALEYATGKTAVVMGKPSAEFFHAALQQLTAGQKPLNPAQVVMVGDDIVGDVGGAQQAGMHGVLVKTGKFRAQDLDGEVNPDSVLESIAELPQWWMQTKHG